MPKTIKVNRPVSAVRKAPTASRAADPEGGGGRVPSRANVSRIVPAASDMTASKANSVWKFRTPWLTSQPPIVGPSAKPSEGVTPNREIANPTRPRGATARRAVSITPVFPSWKPTRSNANAASHRFCASHRPAKTTISTYALRAMIGMRP